MSQYNTSGVYVADNSINGSYYGDWVVIKMPLPLLLTKYGIYQDTNNPTKAPAEWRVYGSDDGINFNEIIEKTGAELVLSSDWKHYYTMNQMKEIFLEFNGVIKAPFDRTPFSSEYTAMNLEGGRVTEIKMWLEENKEKLGITHWVAVDDLKMFELENFVNCPKSMEGIKQSGVKEKILKFLL
jgi:hypothetical protein